MDDLAVYLVPIGGGRFELYTEPPDEPASAVPKAGPDESAPGSRKPGIGEGARRQLHRLHERWRHAVHAAETTGRSSGRVARWRDALVRRIAESIAEQRTLWSLRGVTSASLVHPSDLSASSAAAMRERLLAHSRRHHGRWLLVDLIGVAVTAILVLLPGPNLIGYYFVFRVVGHYLSWQGARHALLRTVWRTRSEPAAFFDRLDAPRR